mgnify:CR=1 FL=1
MNVRETLAAILGAVNAEIPADTVDTIKIGDPEMTVTGIATCFTATPEAIREAVRLGANLIITHEPTFYDHRDQIGWLAETEVYKRKRALLEASGVAMCRFHDLAHMNQPDLIMTGMENALGWTGLQDPTNPWIYRIQPTTLLALCEQLKRTLDADSVRMVGPGELPAARVALVPGACPIEMQIEILKAGADVLVVGETCEWLIGEYVRDANQLGMNLGLAVFGHRNTEEEGMRHVASWIRNLMPEVPVHFLSVGDPLKPV